MYHGIKYKGLRYKIFSFRWKRKNRNWKDCPKKRKAMKKDWEMKVKNNVSRNNNAYCVFNPYSSVYFNAYLDEGKH